MFEEYVPDVEFEAYCPTCETILVHDYYWFCNPCRFMWDSDGSSGKYVSDDEEFYDDGVIL